LPGFRGFHYLRSDAGTSAAGHGCGISDVCIPDTVSYPCFFTTAYDLCFLINGSNYLHCGSESDRKDPGYSTSLLAATTGMRKTDKKMEIATRTLFSHPHSLSGNHAPLPSQAKAVTDTGVQLFHLIQILHQNFYVNFFITSHNENLKKLHHIAARSIPKNPFDHKIHLQIQIFQKFPPRFIFHCQKTDFTGRKKRKNDSCNRPGMVALNSPSPTFHYYNDR